MTSTTTNTLQIANDGIIISKMNTKSGFKKVYRIEQAHCIAHEVKGNKIRLLIDVTKIDKYSIENLLSLIEDETTDVSSAIGIVIKSNFQKLVLNTILNFKSQIKCPVQAFVSINNAKNWLNRMEVAA